MQVARDSVTRAAVVSLNYIENGTPHSFIWLIDHKSVKVLADVIKPLAGKTPIVWQQYKASALVSI